MKGLQRQLDELVMNRVRPSVSIYMPMELSTPDWHENRIRFKNLLKRAEDLSEGSVHGANLKPLESLLEEESFWRVRTPGLACFHSPAGTRVLRLPIAPAQLAVVEDRFHLKPLLAILGEPGRFHVIAVSQSATRLLEVTRDDVRRVDAPEMPDSIHVTLPEEMRGKQLQYHSGGGRSAIYHGQGAGERRETEDLRRYLCKVDAALRQAIPDEESPLVLAGVAEIVSMFKSLSEHRNIVESAVEGNVDRLSDSELAERARPLANEKLREARRNALRRIEELSHTDRVIAGVEEIVRAAVDGRVDALFVARDERCWGTFDDASRTVTVDERQSPKNLDLFDLAAVRTYDQGGAVFIVEAGEMPGERVPVVALLRY